MQEEDGLVCAYDFDGQGGARPIGWEDIAATPSAALRWIHLDRSTPRARRWLASESGLDETAVRALLAEDTRPRFTAFEDGVLLNLRGVNLNPGAAPEDMVAIRMWITPGRIVSARHYRILAVQGIQDAIAAGRGPRTIGNFIATLASGLTERMEPTLDALEDELADLEEQLVERPSSDLRRRLGGVRRKAITLRRYISGQRDALAHLLAAKPPWADEDDRERLNEQVDRVTRYVEDLDVLRERAFVLQDELYSQLSDRMNRIVYILTVITGVFLPITFLTGLLGINVGGMPGVESDTAFWIVCAIVAAVIPVEILLFRFLRWI